MNYIYNDGGRQAAGYTGKTGDCVTRAIAIATGKPYQEVYDALNMIAKRKRRRQNARTGLHRSAYEDYLISAGWQWYPTMKIGQGCTTHLTAGELPQGRLIVAVSKHLTAVIDGTIHDNHDPSRGGTRCVYGYYRKGGAAT